MASASACFRQSAAAPVPIAFRHAAARIDSSATWYRVWIVLCIDRVSFIRVSGCAVQNGNELRAATTGESTWCKEAAATAAGITKNNFVITGTPCYMKPIEWTP